MHETPWSTVRYDERWREKLDPEMVELCDLLNQLGLKTVYSCCGHGDGEAIVWFDGNSAPDYVFERFARFLIANHDRNPEPDVSYYPWMSKVIRKNGEHEWQLQLKCTGAYADTPSDVCYQKMMAILKCICTQLRMLTSPEIVAYHTSLNNWLCDKPAQPDGYSEYTMALEAWLESMPELPPPYVDYEPYRFPESDEP